MGADAAVLARGGGDGLRLEVGRAAAARGTGGSDASRRAHAHRF